MDKSIILNMLWIVKYFQYDKNSIEWYVKLGLYFDIPTYVIELTTARSVSMDD
jgi:hypothetical protein